ncbi:retrovirus-related Pol polyprotein from transposon 297 [Trichonephila clavipes]|nr:retrovirus-related Pol polyprotein from transposon 297 [Trichonephila clavipes]
MAELLNGLEDFVVPYLDDIAIFSDTWESHIKHMETVLQRIKRAKLTIKPSKCIAGYYQKYINLLSVIAAPLTDALKGRAKKGEIKWTTECENAFRELKGKLIDKPVLYAPNFEREFIVQTDASNAGMGAVLTQLTEQGEEPPILYLSKKFSEVEKRYCTTEKECASIVFAIKRFDAHTCSFRCSATPCLTPEESSDRPEDEGRDALNLHASGDQRILLSQNSGL